MSKLLQLRGGTTSEHSTFTGALREVTVDTTKDTLVVHDGSTAGGFAMPSSADKTKLDTIEASATADQTDAEIRAAVEAATDSNVFTDADHSKLNAIEASATADQSNAEIRTAVEAATDSNVFTDADHTKLNAIEASATADQSDAEIKTAVESATSIALGGSPTTTTQAASDNSTKISTTAYADAAIAALVDSSPAALNTLNELAAALGDDANYATTTATAIGTKMPLAGGAFTGAVTTNSTIDGRDVAADGVLATNALPKSGGAMTGAITTNSTFDGRDVAADGVLATNALPKSGGAMTGAITTNSTFDGVDIATRDAILTSTTTTAGAALPKAGGAMTGAITTNSTFDGVDIATRDGILTSTTTTAGAALPKAGGAMTGAITTNSTFDGRDVAADGAKAVAALPKTGGAMTGAITTNSTFDGRDVATDGTKLDNVSTPTVTGSSVTAANASHHVVSAGGITITLPANPSAGNYVIIKDGTGVAETTTFTVGRNGKNIASAASDLVFDKNFAQITMTYVNSSIGWSI